MTRDPRRPVDDEPAFEPATVTSAAQLRERVEGAGEPGRPVVVAVDGRSAGGKTTLAQRLADGAAGWVSVHTDDVAWHHDFFDWADLLRDGVLAPARRGEGVSYRPPAWEERDREGAIEVPAAARVLLVEGVGASRAALAEQIDVAIWVHTPIDTVLAREDERIASGHTAAELSRDWLAAELPFLAADRPWARADLVVSGVGGGDDLTVLVDPAAAAGPGEAR